MNFIKKLIYLYPTLKIFKAHRAGEYKEIKKYFTKLPQSYIESKISFLIIRGRCEMIDSEYASALSYFAKAMKKINNSTSINEDEKNYLLYYINQGLSFCYKHLKNEKKSLMEERLSTYEQTNVRTYIINNFPVV